ncbi:hypothetical protein S40288_02716 [Stachybotrys chartarum IBT 40288]|nr:hypothetical protein S40288_02716 [Stachybotrys chartarum IBT 40288]
MHFAAPSYVERPEPPPSDIPIHEFLFSDGKYGRHPISSSLPPFTCGITGKAYSAEEVVQRVAHLAQALAAELRVGVNEGTEFDKVIGIFSLNAVDTLTTSWATHRLNGVSAPISPSYSAAELTRQLVAVKCKALFTCTPLAATAIDAAAAAGIPRERIYLIDIPEKACMGVSPPEDLRTLDQLIALGRKLAPLEGMQWDKDQGSKQTAYLCSSSGTSGLPKNVMISHRNVISNCIAFQSYERVYKPEVPEMSLGSLPLSHSYALIGTGHAGLLRGDGLVVLPGFDLLDVLGAIQTYKLSRLWLVPPMVVGLIRASVIANKFDLSSVKHATVGASNLTKDVWQQFSRLFPGCKLAQGYGLTEAAVIVSVQNPQDNLFGSCGYLLPTFEGRLVDEEMKDVGACGKAGELVLRSDSIMLGYLDNQEASSEAFTEDGWLRTGDLFELRKDASGNVHMFFVDRLKELIKVRGMQVSPTELETHLARHPAVADSIVVPIVNEATGELPIAFIVRTPDARNQDEKALKESIHAHFNAEMADYKRLGGGIEFVDALPKTAAGKTQRGTMKQKAKAVYEASRAKAAPVVVQTFEFDTDEEDDDDE